jgi:hypothetical protein
MEPIFRDIALQFVFVLFAGFMGIMSVAVLAEHSLNSMMARFRERARNVN